MATSVLSISQVLENLESMDVADQEYIKEILTKRLSELKRLQIADRAKEAEQNYISGKIKKGTIDDLWKDLND